MGLKVWLANLDVRLTEILWSSKSMDISRAFVVLQDIEGVLIANISSYMGGVDLWQNEEDHEDDFDPQYMHDKTLEVVGICGAWHLGKLQVANPPLRLCF